MREKLNIGNYEFQSNGGSDIFIVNYDKDGDIKWASAFGSNANDSMQSTSLGSNIINETSDGGLIVSVVLGANAIIEDNKNR